MSQNDTHSSYLLKTPESQSDIERTMLSQAKDRFSPIFLLEILDWLREDSQK